MLLFFNADICQPAMLPGIWGGEKYYKTYDGQIVEDCIRACRQESTCQYVSYVTVAGAPRCLLYKKENFMSLLVSDATSIVLKCPKQVNCSSV